jgi:hypothetical protein
MQRGDKPDQISHHGDLAGPYAPERSAASPSAMPGTDVMSGRSVVGALTGVFVS